MISRRFLGEDESSYVLSRLEDNAQNVGEGKRFAPALKIPMATDLQDDGLSMTIRIDGASGDEASATTAQIDLKNLSDDHAQMIDPNGVVKIVAGYEDAPAEPEGSDQSAVPQTIFFGSITEAYRVRRGTDRIWKISAHTNPTLLSDGYVPISFNALANEDEEPRTIAEVARQLLSAVGGTLVASAASQGIHPEVNRSSVLMQSYNTTRTVKEELQGLAKAASRQTGRDHRLVEIPSGGPLTWGLIDMSEPRETPVLTLDLDEVTVHSAGPNPKRKEATDFSFPPALLPEGQRPENKKKSKQAKEEAAGYNYRFVGGFDPRVRTGIRANVIDRGGTSGVCSVTSYSHNLSESWESAFEGPFGMVDLQEDI